MTVEHLKIKAYELLPRGMGDADEDYNEQAEVVQLRQIILQMNGQKQLWEPWLQSLQRTLSSGSIMIENWNDSAPDERACKAVLHKGDDGSKLILMVSLLIPYYIFYERVNYGAGKAWEGIRFDISPRWQQEQRNIVEQLKIWLPEYSAFNSDYVGVELENVSFQGVGIIDKFHPSPVLRKLTLFDFYFSNIQL